MTDSLSDNGARPAASAVPSTPTARPGLSPSAARLREAFVIGALVTLTLLGTQYVARSTLKLSVFVPRTLAELSADALSIPASANAMLFFVLIGIAVFVVLGGALAVLYELVRVNLPANFRRGVLGGLLIGVVAFALSMPLEVGRGWTLAGVVTLLFLYLLWGLALDQTMIGAAARPAVTADTDSPMLTRDLFLLQTAVGALLIAMLCIPTAWIIEGRHIPLPKMLLSAPAPTPIPHDQFF